LATYIDKVRSLESENSRLTKQVRTHEETVTREVTNIKGLYENELQDARRLLDDVSKQRAQLKVENEKLAAENKDLLSKNAALELELRDNKRQKLAAEAQVNELQARLNDAVNQRKHWETEYNKARKELDDLKKQLAILQKQHENEMVQRVDLSNRMQSLKEELAFKASVHEKQLEEQHIRTRTEIEEVDGRIQEEYESRLREALQQMREENDAAIEQAREDTQALFASKLGHLKDTAGRNDKAAETARNELRSVRKRMEELSAQVTSLSSQNAGYLSRIAELETRLSREEEEHAQNLAALNASIQQLREALEDQVIEYRDLLDVKIQLDNEITSYRRMLESEETRLNISTAEEATPGRSFRRTPVRSGGAKKRKRGQDDLGQSYFQSGSSVGYSQKSSAKGSVEVFETDTDGKYIKLFNNSDKEQSLGGWQLKHTVGEQETFYKFHRSTNLKGQAHITVWSSDSGEAHNPPSDLVMKGQRWFTGDSMVTELLDPQGEEQANRELEKSQMHTTFQRSVAGGSSSGSDLEILEGDPQDKCVIM
jgi:lamin B